MLNNNPYFKKNVTLRYREQVLNFAVSQALFSSQNIDVGTRHLLKTLADQGFINYKKVLDLGCGYGPIGIALKKANPKSEVHMVDKDALALKFSKLNAKLNNVPDINIYGSLGYDDVSDRDYDLIVSNIPAKAGRRVLSHMLKDARLHLRQGGRIAVVVINAIGEYVANVLSDQHVKIIFHKKWPGHWVFHYEFLHTENSKVLPALKSFEIGDYNRGKKTISVGGSHVSIKTTYNLSEFDTLSYETELLLKNIKVITGKQIDRAIIFNPGQGFIPTVVSKLAHVKEIDLIDRDLQALRISRKNLVLNGYAANNIKISHQIGIHVEGVNMSDLVVGILSDEDKPEVHAMFVHEAIGQLAKNGLIIIASSSTAITRIVTFVNSERRLSIVKRQRSKRRSVLILKQKSE